MTTPASRDVSHTSPTVAVETLLEGMPGAVAGAPVRGVVIYKVMGKMFAILSTAGVEGVTLKCDPELAEILRGQYRGVGHRGHLDRRNWIFVRLDADVPFDEAVGLVSQSYELVCAGLTRKQRAELASLSADR